MEIQAIGMSSMSFPQQTSKALTEEETSQLQEIMSRFDPENMTRDDYESMRVELEEAGLMDNVNTHKALKEAGYEPPAPPEGMHGPGRAPGQDEDDDEAKAELLKLLQQLEDEEIDEEFFSTQMRELLQNTGATGNLVDQYV